MRNSFLLLFAACVALGVLFSFFPPHFLEKEDTQFFLNSYDKVTAADACFNFTHTGGASAVASVGNWNKTVQSGGCVPSSALSQGDNMVRLQAGAQSLFFHVNKTPDAEGAGKVTFHNNPAKPNDDNNPLLSLVLPFFLFLLPGLFVCSFFKQAEPALIFSASLLLFFVFAWLFSAAGQLAWALPVTVAAAAVFFVKKPRIVLPKVPAKELALIAFFVAITIFSQFCLFSHESPWSVYYERQAEATYSLSSLPASDNLSYLGRPFTFVPAYPLVRAGFSAAAQTSPANSFFIFQLLGNVFLASALVFFSKSLGFDFKRTALVLMFVYSSMFVFGWAIISILHLFAFALFVTALALALRGNWASGLIAGLAALFHASFLFGFPVLFFLLQKKTDLKRVVAFSAAAAAFFLAFYSPTILANGFPNEIHGEQWGYFIKGNLINLGTMTAGLLSIAAIPCLYFGWFKNRKLTAAVWLLAALFLFVSYRLNVFLGLLVAVLFATVFVNKRVFWAAVCVLFAASLTFNLYLYNLESLNAPMKDPFTHLAATTAQTDRLLVEPFYGHISNYYAQRPSLADLYVEYASAEKYDDAVRFIDENDTSALDKWNVSYVVTARDRRVRGVEDYRIGDEIVFPQLDKVYSNIWFNIHYYPR